MFSSAKNKKRYDYKELLKDVQKFKTRYPFCEISSIGESVLKRKLFCLKIGEGENIVFYNGAHHGAESITSALLMKFIEEYAESVVEDGEIFGMSSNFLYKNVSLYVVPMVNPDGVELSVNGGRMYSADFPRLFRENKGSADFSLWQANFNGVDLNHNYDALWELSRKGEIEHNIFGPGPTRYAGEEPFSEPETRAMAEFTKSKEIKLSMAFHSQGQEIYYDFNNKEPIYSLFIANALSLGTVYNPSVPTGIASYGGYKDWFIENFGRLAFTIEVGKGENPLPPSDLNQIYKETLKILVGGMKVACLI